MHSEIRQQKPGNCSICGMRLVLEGEAKSHSAHHVKKDSDLKNYTPLFIIVGLILLTSLAISFNQNSVNLKSILQSFMAGFFIVFAGFKLIDLKGFADGYFTYDLLAKKWYQYGYVYPFIELFFGLAMIVGLWTTQILILEIIVMTFSGIGVLQKIMKGEKFQCVCLGTFLKVPLTKVTLIEDFGMAALAVLMLLLA